MAEVATVEPVDVVEVEALDVVVPDPPDPAVVVAVPGMHCEYHSF